MSRSVRARAAAAATLAVVALGTTGCGGPSTDAKLSMKQALEDTDSVASVTVGTQSTALFRNQLLAQVTLKPGVDPLLFELQAENVLAFTTGLSDAQINVTYGRDGFSVVSDPKLTESSRNLVDHLKQTESASEVKAFLGDLEVHLPSVGTARPAFHRLLNDPDAKRVVADGTLKVSANDESLGKRGTQRLDPSLERALEAATSGGATTAGAFMDPEQGPRVAAAVADPARIGDLRERVRGVGYTGPLEITAGKVTITDDVFNANSGLAAALASTLGVLGVDMGLPPHFSYNPFVGVRAESPTAMVAAANAVHDRGLATVNRKAVPYHIDAGTSYARGTTDTLPARAETVRDLLRQAAVQRTTIRDEETVVWLDADKPDQWQGAFATLRAHQWWNARTITVMAMRGEQVTEQARFESTASGKASLANTGDEGQSVAILTAWNNTAAK